MTATEFISGLLFPQCPICGAVIDNTLCCAACTAALIESVREMRVLREGDHD